MIIMPIRLMITITPIRIAITVTVTIAVVRRRYVNRRWCHHNRRTAIDRNGAIDHRWRRWRDNHSRVSDNERRWRKREWKSDGNGNSSPRRQSCG